MDKINGSMDVLNAMLLTEQMEGLDAQSKTLFRSKEVLAVILQGVVAEYRDYSRQEIMSFIEADSIVDGKEVSPGRTNTQVQGDATEFVQLNEKVSHFDLAFRARNPKLSMAEVLVNLQLVIIKLGDEVYNGEKGDEGFELLHFLNAIMYPHREDFIEKISDYIVFSENEELWKEEPHMFSLSQCIYEDGLEEGIEKGIEKGIAAFVLDYVEENIPKEKCVQKLQKRFSLTKEKAEEYYERFVGRT